MTMQGPSVNFSIKDYMKTKDQPKKIIPPKNFISSNANARPTLHKLTTNQIEDILDNLQNL